jgi:multidrug efflux pump subunit AcrB
VAETSALLARGNHAMIYGTTISLHVAIADPDTGLGATIDEVTDELAQIDQRTPELLDYAVSSDATDNSVVFEVTVDADDDMEALAAAASWVRAAIHATGGYTPDWITGGVEGTVERIATHA